MLRIPWQQTAHGDLCRSEKSSKDCYSLLLGLISILSTHGDLCRSEKSSKDCYSLLLGLISMLNAHNNFLLFYFIGKQVGLLSVTKFFFFNFCPSTLSEIALYFVLVVKGACSPLFFILNRKLENARVFVHMNYCKQGSFHWSCRALICFILDIFWSKALF